MVLSSQLAAAGDGHIREGEAATLEIEAIRKYSQGAIPRIGIKTDGV